jgi:hypothetical protein
MQASALGLTAALCVLLLALELTNMTVASYTTIALARRHSFIAKLSVVL